MQCRAEWTPNPHLPMHTNWLNYREAVLRQGLTPSLEQFASLWWPPDASAPASPRTGDAGAGISASR